MSLLATVLLLALSRAELIQRLKAPVVTQAEGFVKVYARCAEDLRREYQTPVARFAADTVQVLCQGLSMKLPRQEQPGLLIHLGDIRTNVSEVVTRVTTNDSRVVTRIYLPSPGYANLDRLRLDIIRAFYRSLRQEELDDAAAIRAFRAAVPSLRAADERLALEEFVREGRGDYEEGLRLLRKVIEPGKASCRDVLTFAARLYLYPPQYDLRFLGRYDRLSLREALAVGRGDLGVRMMALSKADETVVFGGGKSPELYRAAQLYSAFLREFARNERSAEDLAALLESAETALEVAFETARKYEGERQS